MYDYHRARHDALYSNYALYSPDVPVLRDDEGTLLEAPYPCAFLTSPAVNANVVRERDSGRDEEITRAMRERVRKVLTLGVSHGHDSIVLGAWGCGVFGNNGEEIAGLLREALATHFEGAFARVVFAVLDTSPEQRFIGPFERAFSS